MADLLLQLEPQETVTRQPGDRRVIADYLRCPDDSLRLASVDNVSAQPGFFHFGSDLVCYGRCSGFVPPKVYRGASQLLQDVLEYTRTEDGVLTVPFTLSEIVDGLRREKYAGALGPDLRRCCDNSAIRAGYYAVRPFLTVSVRKHIQRLWLRGWERKLFPAWPVDTTVERLLDAVVGMALDAAGQQEIPMVWFWPEGKRACCLMTHDVESAAGRDFCDRLMDVDDAYEIKSSFQVIPERRYRVSTQFLHSFWSRGFELNVHDLNHDGKLFEDFGEFERRCRIINEYATAFGARGFRAAVLYRNTDWLEALAFQYDMSIPNVAHLDPQPGGCCTVFPFFMGDLLEIPTTMTQDYSLFHLLRQYSIDLWKEQAAIVLEKHGVMNFITHPDYLAGKKEMRVYKELLGYLNELRDTEDLWIPLPCELNEWWRQRSRMRLVKNGRSWKIEGDPSGRARLAFATRENGKVVYKF